MISARFSANAWLSSTIRYLRMRASGRQLDDEARAASLALLIGDRAAVTLDDAPHQRQPEPDAFCLGRDQRLEQPALHARIEPRPRILDGDHQLAAAHFAAHAHLAA